MIKVDFFRNEHKEVSGFRMSGHAAYAEEGSDIVCSAVSILSLNTVNCIEEYTDADFSVEADIENGGFMEFSITPDEKGEFDHDALLMLKVMAKGLTDIKNEYSCYISINDEEVQ